jgi:hypothetical protein
MAVESAVEHKQCIILGKVPLVQVMAGATIIKILLLVVWALLVWVYPPSVAIFALPSSHILHSANATMELIPYKLSS